MQAYDIMCIVSTLVINTVHMFMNAYHTIIIRTYHSCRCFFCGHAMSAHPVGCATLFKPTKS